jgi:hypothetical protein
VEHSLLVDQSGIDGQGACRSGGQTGGFQVGRYSCEVNPA